MFRAPIPLDCVGRLVWEALFQNVLLKACITRTVQLKYFYTTSASSAELNHVYFVTLLNKCWSFYDERVLRLEKGVATHRILRVALRRMVDYLRSVQRYLAVC